MKELILGCYYGRTAAYNSIANRKIERLKKGTLLNKLKATINIIIGPKMPFKAEGVHCCYMYPVQVHMHTPLPN